MDHLLDGTETKQNRKEGRERRKVIITRCPNPKTRRNGCPNVWTWYRDWGNEKRTIDRSFGGWSDQSEDEIWEEEKNTSETKKQSRIERSRSSQSGETWSALTFCSLQVVSLHRMREWKWSRWQPLRRRWQWSFFLATDIQSMTDNPLSVSFSLGMGQIETCAILFRCVKKEKCSSLSSSIPFCRASIWMRTWEEVEEHRGKRSQLGGMLTQCLCWSL